VVIFGLLPLGALFVMLRLGKFWSTSNAPSSLSAAERAKIELRVKQESRECSERGGNRREEDEAD